MPDKYLRSPKPKPANTSRVGKHTGQNERQLLARSSTRSEAIGWLRQGWCKREGVGGRWGENGRGRKKQERSRCDLWWFFWCGKRGGRKFAPTTRARRVLDRGGTYYQIWQGRKERARLHQAKLEYKRALLPNEGDGVERVNSARRELGRDVESWIPQRAVMRKAGRGTGGPQRGG